MVDADMVKMEVRLCMAEHVIFSIHKNVAGFVDLAAMDQMVVKAPAIYFIPSCVGVL